MHAKKRNKVKGEDDKDKHADPLSYEVIHKLCQEHGLTTSQVFSLDSEFGSLVELQKEEIEKKIKQQNRKMFDSTKREAEDLKL